MVLQPVDLRDDIGVRPLVVGIVSILLATTAVFLRFYSHRIKKTAYTMDDWMILIALVGTL